MKSSPDFESNKIKFRKKTPNNLGIDRDKKIGGKESPARKNLENWKDLQKFGTLKDFK